MDRRKKRHNVKNIHVHGSGGATDMVEGEKRTAMGRATMVGMDPELILNMDEAALFYELAPTKSYILECDSRETRVTALQSAKARITITVCMNATGSFKYIAVIGKAAHPVCFRVAPPLPIKYYHQKSA